jgi:hypothetical protein
MIKGTKVKIISRRAPNNQKAGEIVHMFKDNNGIWITVIDYPDGERYFAIEGVDQIKATKAINQKTLDDY